MLDDRREFLIKMYDQMFNDINTHILVVWQSVGVVVGAFAVFSLVEKNIIPTDFACSLMILLCAWLIAHLYDASYWYNRNLVIIANIERQFLKKSDLSEVQYYFGKHRGKSAMLTHLRIQYGLGVAIAGMFLTYHFSLRVWPGITAPASHFEFTRASPTFSQPPLSSACGSSAAIASPAIRNSSATLRASTSTPKASTTA